MPLGTFAPVHSIIFKTGYSIQKQGQGVFSLYHFVPLCLFNLMPILKLDIQFTNFKVNSFHFVPVLFNAYFKIGYSIQKLQSKLFSLCHFVPLCLFSLIPILKLQTQTNTCIELAGLIACDFHKFGIQNVS